MTQEQFESACAVAIQPYHDAIQDGPLLVATRMQSQPSAVLGEWMVYPEYAAVISHWPTQVPFGDYGQFMMEPQDCIVDLVKFARSTWQARQSEPEETDPERLKLDALLAPLPEPAPAPAPTTVGSSIAARYDRNSHLLN